MNQLNLRPENIKTTNEILEWEKKAIINSQGRHVTRLTYSDQFNQKVITRMVLEIIGNGIGEYIGTSEKVFEWTLVLEGGFGLRLFIFEQIPDLAKEAQLRAAPVRDLNTAADFTTQTGVFSFTCPAEYDTQALEGTDEIED